MTGNAAGANNTAFLYDSAGNDVFVANAAYSYLYGGGFWNQANGFSTVVGYSTGGADQAIRAGDPRSGAFHTTTAEPEPSVAKPRRG